MNYQRVYNQLIQSGVTRGKVDGYSEKHHILPRCLGGSDDKSNLVVLTAREHSIAHALLYRIYANTKAGYKMACAWRRMHTDMRGPKAENRYLKSWAYESSRIAAANKMREYMTGRNVGRDSVRYNHELVRYVNTETDEVIESTRQDMERYMSSPEVCRITNKRGTMCKQWMRWWPNESKPKRALRANELRGLDRHAADKGTYTFVKGDQSFTGTRIDFEAHIADDKPTKQGMCDVLKGRTKSHRGWSVK